MCPVVGAIYVSCSIAVHVSSGSTVDLVCVPQCAGAAGIVLARYYMRHLIYVSSNICVRIRERTRDSSQGP